MKQELNGTVYKNVEKFVDFLMDNLKIFYLKNLNKYLDELEQYYCETGVKHYELYGFQTNSNKPEVIYFDVEEKITTDGDMINVNRIIEF